jgi:hypothetical protein
MHVSLKLQDWQNSYTLSLELQDCQNCYTLSLKLQDSELLYTYYWILKWVCFIISAEYTVIYCVQNSELTFTDEVL